MLSAIILTSLLLVGIPVKSAEIAKAETKTDTDLKPSSYDHFRLPTAIKPEHYKLEIITHLNDSKGFEFSGKVYIRILVNENTNNITLHSKNLTIDQSQIIIKPLDSIANDTNINYEIKSIETIPNHDYYVMHLNAPLVKSRRYQIFIPFSADLNKNLFGYYRSSYINKETNQRR